jgi:hypothetical protein
VFLLLLQAACVAPLASSDDVDDDVDVESDGTICSGATAASERSSFAFFAETDLVESCSNMMIPTLVNIGHAREKAHSSGMDGTDLHFSFLVGSSTNVEDVVKRKTRCDSRS